MKPLAAWTRDLVLRVDQLEKWATTAHPPTIFWMSGFTFPTGFLTAVLQTSARLNSVSVDSLSWEFNVMTVDDSNITGPPKVWVFFISQNVFNLKNFRMEKGPFLVWKSS
jgi:dynein heavy chain